MGAYFLFFARTRLAGAKPAPKRTRRGSAIFLEGLRTTGCFLLDMSGFSLKRLSIGFKLRMPLRVGGGLRKVPGRRGLHQTATPAKE